MLVYGVGEHDIRCHGKYERRVYSLWTNMLQRCYSGLYESYKGCTVCKPWLKLSKFMEDIQKLSGYELWRDNPHKRIALDKDIKIQGNKEYSLDACCFVTPTENNREKFGRRPDTKVNQPRKVIGVNAEGNVVRYDSMISAEKDGFKRAGIFMVCSGQRPHYKGYKFSYAD